MKLKLILLTLICSTVGFSQALPITGRMNRLNVDTLQGRAISYLLFNDTTRNKFFVRIDSTATPAAFGAGTAVATLISKGEAGFVWQTPSGTVFTFSGTPAASSITLTTGDGLSGGGDLSANRTFTVNTKATGGLAITSDSLLVDSTKFPATDYDVSLKQNTISVTSPITLTGASVGMVNQGTSTTVLHGNASGNPSFSAVSLTADVTGTLPVANGGTGSTSFTSGSIPYSNGTILTQNNGSLNWNNTDSTLRQPRYYFDSRRLYAEQGGIITIDRRDTSLPTIVRPAVWINTDGRGDTTTNIGTYGLYVSTREDTTGGIAQGTISRKRGVLYGIGSSVSPYTENSPYKTQRDVGGVLVNNSGTVQATAGLYIGGSRHMTATAANTLSTQWRRLLEVDDSADVGFLMNGGNNIGMDWSGTDWLGSNTRLFKSNSTIQSDLGTLTLGGATLDSQLTTQRGIHAIGGLVVGGTANVDSIYGATASVGNMVLSSTSNATKGKINFGLTSLSKTVFDEANNRWGIGIDSAIDVFQIQSNALQQEYLDMYSNTLSSRHLLNFRRANGTSASPTIVANSSEIGSIYFHAYNGSTFTNVARIQTFIAASTAEISATKLPTLFRISTVPAQSTTLGIRFNVDSSGIVGFGTAQQMEINTSGVFTKNNAITVPSTEHWQYAPYCDTVLRGNQTATIGATNLNNTATNGLYRVSIYIYPTTAGTSGTVTGTIAWNDGAASTTTTAAHTFGALGTPVQLTTLCRVTNSTAITWATTVTANIGGVYEVDVLAERIF